MVDGVFQRFAALFFGQARRREQLVQGDVVPAAHHLIQPALGPQAPLEQQAEGQRAAAAHDLGDVGGQVLKGPAHPAAGIMGGRCQGGDALRQADHPHEQQDAAQHGAPADEALPALFGFLLLGGGPVVGLVAGAVVVGGARPGLPVCAGPGVLGAEIGGIAPVCFKSPLLPFFGVLIDGPQDEQQHRQPGREAQQDQQGDDGDAGEIVFVFCLHDTLPARRQIKKTGRAPLYCSRARPVC